VVPGPSRYSVRVKKFRVLLHGENFLFTTEDGRPQVHGFYTTRWVEAENAEAAELAAVELVRSDPGLVEATVNPRDDSPMIYLADLRELADFDGVSPPGAGYTFYTVNPE